MVLCFGTYAKVLKLCKRSDVSNKILVGTLISTVDPDSEYINSDNSTISRLINSGQNLSNGNKRRKGQKREEGNFSQGYETNRLSDIVNLANTADVNVVAQKIQEDFLSLLDADKVKLVVPAIFRIIAEDETIIADKQESFRKCTDLSIKEYLEKNEISISLVVAEILLYTAIINQNRSSECFISSHEIDTAYLSASFDMFPADKIVVTSYNQEGRSNRIDLDNHGGQIDENRIADYLCHEMEKLSTFKSLLYGDESVDFRSLYVCNDILYTVYKHDKETGERSKESYILHEATSDKIADISNFTILTGIGGLGKSMMMRHLFIESAEKYNESGIVPIFVEVRDFGIEFSDLEDFVFSRLNWFESGFIKNDLEKLLKNGKCLLLLDGMDEVSAKHALLFEKELERLTDRYPKNRYIISSRPYGSFVSFFRFTVLKLWPLSKEQAIELIKKLDFRTDIPNIKARFLKELDTRLYYSHRDFANNPLLLTIMLMTFDQFAEVPSKMHVFYRYAFLALANRHDISFKGSYIRQFRTGLTVDGLEAYFSEFCAKTYYNEKYEFTEEEFASYFHGLRERMKDSKIVDSGDFLFDVSSNLCLLYYEGRKYHFIHRSFQEYFCALYFSRQLDKNLKAIGEFFEAKVYRIQGEKTFSMLYDMIPERMNAYVLLPYLQSLVEECKRNDGYWTFLKMIYPCFYYSSGLTDSDYNDHDNVSADSFRYDFIRKNFLGISHTDLELPFYTELIADEYSIFYSEYEDEPGEVIRTADITEEYYTMYGKPEVAGYLLRVEIEELWDDREKYADLFRALEDDSFVLKKEYIAMQRFYQKLSDEQKPRGSELFDLFY